MASETVTAAHEPPSAQTELSVAARRTLALEATWEIAALNDEVRSLCNSLGSGEMDQADLMTLRLKVRGMTSRIAQLNSAAMSILDEECETYELERVIHGDGCGAMA